MKASKNEIRFIKKSKTKQKIKFINKRKKI
jgi:hypothetical protein